MPSLSPADALVAWHPLIVAHPSPGPEESALPAVRPADDGLINLTYFVGTPPRWVLQWVNPIFDARIQLDIEAVTEHLASHGLPTTRLVRTPDGRTHIDDARRPGGPDAPIDPSSESKSEGGVWRLLTFIPGSTIHKVSNARVAATAGRLVGQFHGAMADWQSAALANSRSVHDTPARMADLRLALEACDGHPLAAAARQLGEGILRAWEGFEGELDLPERMCHGDLKISNLRFDAAGENGVCLLDLDTVGPQALACEMGDAWRSWCNPAGENDPDAVTFDIELFEASARGWASAMGRSPIDLAPQECRSLVPGIERICLELAARFCADTVNNTYFREDRERYPGLGEHNLLRARGQVALADSVRGQRSACEAILRRALGKAAR